jgi:hypothetical protein
MAAGPFILVNSAIEAIVDGTIAVETDTIQAVIITSAHTAAATDDTWSDISGSEASGSGYTSEGVTVSPLSISRAGGVVTVDCATDPSWDPATLAGKYVYLVRQAGGSLVSGDLILGYMDLNVGGGNLSAVADEFTVEWPVDGLFTLSRAA